MIFLFVLFACGLQKDENTVRHLNTYEIAVTKSYVVANGIDSVEFSVIGSKSNKYKDDVAPTINYTDTIDGVTNAITSTFKTSVAGTHTITAKMSDGQIAKTNIIAIPTNIQLSKSFSLLKNKLISITDNEYDKYLTYRRKGNQAVDLDTNTLKSIGNTLQFNSFWREEWDVYVDEYLVGSMNIIFHRIASEIKGSREVNGKEVFVQGSGVTIKATSSKSSLKIDNNIYENSYLNNLAAGKYSVLVLSNVLNNIEIPVDRYDIVVLPKLTNDFRYDKDNLYQIKFGSLTPGEMKSKTILALSDANSNNLKIKRPEQSEHLFVVSGNTLKFSPLIAKEGGQTLKVVFENIDIAEIKFDFRKVFAATAVSNWTPVRWCNNNCYFNTTLGAFFRIMEINGPGYLAGQPIEEATATKLREFLKAYQNSMNLGEKGAAHKGNLAFEIQECFRKVFDEANLAQFEDNNEMLVGDKKARDAVEFMGALIGKAAYSSAKIEYDDIQYLKDSEIFKKIGDTNNIYLLNLPKNVPSAELSELGIGSGTAVPFLVELYNFKGEKQEITSDFVRRYSTRGGVYGYTKEGQNYLVKDGKEYLITDEIQAEDNKLGESIELGDIATLESGKYIFTEIIEETTLHHREKNNLTKLSSYLKAGTEVYIDGKKYTKDGVFEEEPDEKVESLGTLKFTQTNENGVIEYYAAYVLNKVITKDYLVSTTNRHRFTKYPDQLIVAIKRFNNDNKKNELPVKVGEQYKLGDQEYSLLSYVKHVPGHYIGYIKGEGDVWYEHDMDKLQKIDYTPGEPHPNLPHTNYDPGIYLTFWKKSTP